MKHLFFIIIFQIYTCSLFGEIQIGISSNINNQATISFTATTAYNSNPANRWNSTAFSIQYPMILGPSAVTSVTATSAYAIELDGPALLVGAFYIQNFVSSNSNFIVNFTSGQTINVATVFFASNTNSPQTFELVNSMTNGGTSVNNALFGEVFLDFNPSSASVVLPITIKSFSASKDGERTSRLDWTSSSEINSDYIGIERSTDGQYWTTIAQVEAAGNSNTDVEYVYYDRSLPMVRSIDNIYYYRLKLVDLDGQYKYSETRGVNMGRLAGLVSIYPNPATDIINVDLTDMDLHDGDIHLSVYDNTGKTIISKVVSGAGIEPIQASNMAAGTYQVMVKQGEKTHHKQIIVVN